VAQTLVSYCGCCCCCYEVLRHTASLVPKKRNLALNLFVCLLPLHLLLCSICILILLLFRIPISTSHYSSPDPNRLQALRDLQLVGYSSGSSSATLPNHKHYTMSWQGTIAALHEKHEKHEKHETNSSCSLRRYPVRFSPPPAQYLGHH
jgi:hypothetical protein